MKMKYERNCGHSEEFFGGSRADMELNFWEHENSVKVNFGDHLNSFLRNKETTVNF